MAKSRNQGAAETVMLGQSALLMGIGLAGYMASDTVVAMSNALQDKESAMYIITDNAVVTDKTTISTDAAMGIVSNFSLVCLVAFCIGTIIFLANVIRRIKS